MKKKVDKAVMIDDGKHIGKIKEINYKDKPYEYVDIVVTEAVKDIDLKCGVPFHITENSALGKILINFGATLKIDTEIEIEDFIKAEAEVEFTTITEETKKGNFARIMPQTLKPK